MDYNITYRQKDKGIQCIISYKDELGKWKQKSKQGFTKKSDAKRFADNMLDELKKRIETQAGMSDEYDDITFKQLSSIYIEHKKLHRTFTTVNSMRIALNKLSKLDLIPIDKITNAHLQSCIDDVAREGLQANSINRYLSMIKTFFNDAIKRKIIKDNPANNIIIPEYKKDDRIKALNKSELDHLLSSLTNEKYKLISTIAATCGLRMGEIIGLTWDSVNFKDSTLKIDKQWKRLSMSKYGYGAVKQKNSNRTVPIPPGTLRELETYKVSVPVHTTRRIFYQNENISSLGKVLSTIYQKAGYDVTIHDLRHTYATLLISNGVDFKTAAKLLGHDVEMTMKVYSHVTDDMMKRATSTVNSIFH